MKPSFQLISALRRAADKIEAPDSGYAWICSERCNCGLLAQELGLDPAVLSTIGSWGSAIERGYCDVLKRPLTQVFAVLRAAGLGDDDLVALEDCGTTCDKVAQYLNAQASLLEEQLTLPAVQKQGVEHGCSHLFISPGDSCLYCGAVKQSETAVNSAD